MRIRVLLLIVSMLATCLASAATAQPAAQSAPQPASATLQNDEFKFSASVPDGWRQADNATVLDVVYTLAPSDAASLKGPAIVIITARHLPQRPVMGSPLRSFVRSVYSTLLGEEVGLVTMNESELLASGVPAIRFRTEYKKEDRRRVGHHCAILHGGDGIEIGCTVDLEDEKFAAETLDRLLASIRWAMPPVVEADLATFSTPAGMRGGFSFRHNAKWTAARDAPRGYLAVIQSTDWRTRENRPAVTLGIYAPKPQPAGASDAEQLSKAANDYVRTFTTDNKGVKLIDRTPVTIDGAPGEMLTMEGTVSRINVHIRTLVVVRGGQLYTIELMVPPEFVLELRAVIQPLWDSWKWAK